MGILAWIIFGLIAGVIAKLLMPGRDPGGIIITILLGIGGAILGGYLGTWLGWGDIHGFDLRSFCLAIGGTLLILLAYRLIFRPRPVM
jgi:uncharacterized membrane protein YeaQ/YmgE (transglycosylase-associated protein family)